MPQSIFPAYSIAPTAWTPSARTHKDTPGLGLSISQQILLQHGDRITVERKSGKGSCFTARLTLQPS
jgi:signal transduction histidine kinase